MDSKSSNIFTHILIIGNRNSRFTWLVFIFYKESFTKISQITENSR